jgi:hypothetical protein
MNMLAVLCSTFSRFSRAAGSASASSPTGCLAHASFHKMLCKYYYRDGYVKVLCGDTELFRKYAFIYEDCDRIFAAYSTL